MRLKDYLNELGKNDSVTFIIAEAQKDKHTPFTSYVYRGTPIRTVWEWEEATSMMDYIVVNKDHSPIDITGHWCRSYKAGHLKCCVLTSEETMFQMYSEKQAKDMIDYYERTVK